MTARRPNGQGRARGASPSRRLRAIGGRMIRRLGLIPAGMPDRRGEDAALAGTGLAAEVIVYFPDPPESLYQIRQWYGPLTALDRRHRVAVITADSRTAAAIRGQSALEVHTIARPATLDDVLSRSPVKLVLYPNHSVDNFTMLRFPFYVHASLTHGDSDKVVTISGQTKAYDFTFVPGRAAVDRLIRYLPLFDAEARCLVVGRPQLDGLVVGDGEGAGSPGQFLPLGLLADDQAVPDAAADGDLDGFSSLGPQVDGQAVSVDAAGQGTSVHRRIRVLYAPTWEGDQATVAYGSVASHGLALAAALLADARFALVYRPHPASGVRLASYGQADQAIRSMIAVAIAADPSAGHRLATEGELADTFPGADVVVCDISSVAIDWLVTGRPLVVTTPTEPAVVVAHTPVLDAAARLDAPDAARLPDILADLVRTDPQRQRRNELRTYYLGDTTPGAALEAFLGACDHLIDLAADQRERIGL